MFLFFFFYTKYNLNIFCHRLKTKSVSGLRHICTRAIQGLKYNSYDKDEHKQWPKGVRFLNYTGTCLAVYSMC